MRVLSKQKIKLKHLLAQETKHHVLYKFLAIVTIFLGYFGFIASKYGLQEGMYVSILTWSFFVLCTPVADAGFLIDFPLRLLTKIHMYVSEIFIWIAAISLNLFSFFLHPDIYNKTQILNLFKHILENPFPFWGIIVLSGLGTFASVIFGDELLNESKHTKRKLYHKHKYNYKLFLMFFVFLASFVIYDFLLKKLGVNLPI